MINKMVCLNKIVLAEKGLDKKTNLYPLMKGYFRETCKSQSINDPISLTPHYTLGIIQIHGTV